MNDFIPFVVGPLAALAVYIYLMKNNKLSRLKKSSLLIFLIAFIITEAGRSFYRPYIYSNNLNDYFLADTIGNSFGTVTAIFFILTVVGKGRTKDILIIILVITGLLLYESINIFLNSSIDTRDIISTIIFGIISILIYKALLIPEEKNIEV